MFRREEWAPIRHTKGHSVAHLFGVVLIGLRKWIPNIRGIEHKTTHVRIADCACCGRSDVYHYHAEPYQVTACDCPSCGLVWHDLKGAENG